MSESTRLSDVESERTDEDAVSERMERMVEFARRTLNGERVADVVGVDDRFMHEVLSQAYQLYRAGNLKHALVLVEGVAALDETRAYPHLLLGDIFLREKRYADAAQQFERARKLTPDSGEVLAKLGEASLHIGELSEAQGLLHEALTKLPRESTHHKRSSVLLDVMDVRAGDSAPVDVP